LISVVIVLSVSQCIVLFCDESMNVFVRVSCLTASKKMKPVLTPSHLCLSAVFVAWWSKATSRPAHPKDTVHRRFSPLMTSLVALSLQSPVVVILGTGELW